MHRLAAVALALSVAATACASGSGRETEVPEIPDTLPVTGSTVAADAAACTLGFGTGRGAEVLEVVAGVPAATVISVGDVVVAVDGETISDSTGLIQAIQAHGIGDTIAVDIDRDGEAVSGEIELVEHTDSPGTPMAGLSIRTAVDLVPAADLETTVAPALLTPATMVVAMEERLFALDPVAGNWEAVADRVPEEPWAAVRGGVYTLVDSDPDDLVEVLTGAISSADDGVWDGRWVVGSMGGRVLVLAERGAAGEAESALLAVQPETGVASWEWQPGPGDSGFPLVPILAIPDPSQRRSLVVLAELAPGATEAESLSLLVVDDQGRPIDVVPPAQGLIPPGSAAIGWHEPGGVAYLPTDRGSVLVWEIATGEVTSVSLPRLESADDLVPIGDAAHFIMDTGTGLDLVSEDTVRPLSIGCSPDRISALGYGAPG